MADLRESKITSYDFEIPLSCGIAKAWSVLVDGIDDWWMTDFRTLGKNSKMTLSAKPGGALLEQNHEGAFLEWYRVQYCQPGKLLQFAGYLAPDWGGPTLSMLKLELDQRNDGSVLRVSDALSGVVSQNSMASAKSGWKMLFGEGFKTIAEK